VQDTGEATATTNATGGFQLDLGDAAGGMLVLAAAAGPDDCRDSATGLPLRLPLSAPLGASALSPLTSLVRPFSSSVAAQVQGIADALSEPDRAVSAEDVLNRDATQMTAAGDAGLISASTQLLSSAHQAAANFGLEAQQLGWAPFAALSSALTSAATTSMVEFLSSRESIYVMLGDLEDLIDANAGGSPGRRRRLLSLDVPSYEVADRIAAGNAALSDAVAADPAGTLESATLYAQATQEWAQELAALTPALLPEFDAQTTEKAAALATTLELIRPPPPPPAPNAPPMPPLLPPEPTPTPTPEPSSDLDIALIAGSAAGGLVLLLLVVGAALFCVWKGCPCCGKGAKAPAGDPLWGSESEKANRPMEIDLTHRYHPVRRTHMASNPVYKPPRPPGSDEDDLDDVDL